MGVGPGPAQNDEGRRQEHPCMGFHCIDSFVPPNFRGGKPNNVNYCGALKAFKKQLGLK